LREADNLDPRLRSSEGYALNTVTVAFHLFVDKLNVFATEREGTGPMNLPGFKAENSLGALVGRYRSGAGAPVLLGVSPQLPIGLGPVLGNCCCISCDLGFPVAIAASATRLRRFAALSSVAPQLSLNGWQWSLGACTITCTTCPEGDGDCECSCQDNGLPCATVGNVQACE
jgi:hypothetical protein